MTDNIEIGKFIALMRKSKGLTQSALAEVLNLSNRTISKWETGEGLPDVSTLPELAQALGVSVDELLKAKKDEKSLKVENVANEKNMLNIFRICSVISFFACVSGALLGGFTNIYCYAHFFTLFYTHWEIIFDVLAFAAIVLGNLLFYASAMRLNVVCEKDRVIALSFKKAIALTIISSSFFVAFIARVANRYIQLEITVAIAAGLIGAIIILGGVVASKKIEKKLKK